MLQLACARSVPRCLLYFELCPLPHGSCFEFHDEHKLVKKYRKEVKKCKLIGRQMGVLAIDQDLTQAHEKGKPIYMLRTEFQTRFAEVVQKAVCPGIPK